MNNQMPQAPPPQPPQISIPMMPELFANALPPSLPPMQFESGLLVNFFHNWRLGQLKRGSEREADIAENYARKAKANLALLAEFMTFQAKVQDQFRELDYNEKKRNLDIEIMAAQRDEIKLKNQNLYYETRISEMEFRKREKEFEETYGPKPA